MFRWMKRGWDRGCVQRPLLVCRVGEAAVSLAQHEQNKSVMNRKKNMVTKCCGFGLHTGSPLQFDRILLRTEIKLCPCAFRSNPCCRVLGHPLSTRAKRFQGNKAADFYRLEAGANYL
ncbi:hypothetical protein TRVL_09165 [Trypanosoma vivax]|nr:hypothetical protein TRVL_09165 [Trypanosoma vivax]